jgi:tRNA wybutosine-synthesizing protein 1
MMAFSPIEQRSKFDPVTTRRYLRAGYRLIGTHSGIQICRWTRAALVGRRLCYKRWYGIRSHRCIQLTPSLQFCNLRCNFCWRFHTSGRFEAEHEWDPPKLILDEAIAAQRKLLSGYKANPHVTESLFKEAMEPIHVAVSLDGEPMLYPMIVDLTREIDQRGMTSFLVTNGTMPNRLQEMLEQDVQPTNLYISLYGPDEKTFQNVARPLIPETWQKVLDSLRLLPSFKRSRTIARLTLVKRENMHNPEGYSRLILEGTPSIVELKGYSWLGESRHRLPINAMPYQSEIREFARRIVETTGYEIVTEDTISRVVLLARDASVARLSLDAL